MTNGITVIVPTIGRQTLRSTLQSFADELTDLDEVIVISDGITVGVSETVQQMSNLYNGGWRYLGLEDQLGHYGHAARNLALSHHVRTSHVWSIDDDDVACSGALTSMRSHYDAPWVVYRMQYGLGHPAKGHTLPNSRRVEYGNIGTPMIFAPITPARFGLRYAGDLDYAVELQNLLGEPVWSDRTIAIIYPNVVSAA